MKGEALLIKVPAPGFTSLLRAPREKKWRLCCWVFFFFYIVPQPGQKKSIITLELLKQLGIMPLTMGKRNLFPLTRKSPFLLLIIHLKIKPIRWNIYLICYIQKLKNVDLKPKTLNKCPWNSWVVCFFCLFWESALLTPLGPGSCRLLRTSTGCYCISHQDSVLLFVYADIREFK